MKRNTPEMFWGRVVKTDDCWLWPGTTDRKGYGVFKMIGYSQRTHRIAWELTNGPIPKGLCVCHKCDVRNCVNPEHLFLGTIEANTADMVAKNRQCKGEKRPQAILTERDIFEIKSAYPFISQPKLGALYGVHPAHVCKIVNGVKWGHLHGCKSEQDRRCKLSKEDVQEILALARTVSTVELGRRYGVQQSTISKLLTKHGR